jgi:hypothetical protein
MRGKAAKLILKKISRLLVGGREEGRRQCVLKRYFPYYTSDSSVRYLSYNQIEILRWRKHKRNGIISSQYWNKWYGKQGKPSKHTLVF